MEIISITTPSFEYEGKIMYTESKMYENLRQFQDEIERQERRGVTKCYLYSIYTQHEADITIYWVRYKFIKIPVNNEIAK